MDLYLPRNIFWLQLVTANTGKINTSNNIEGTEINVLHMDIGVISLVRQGFFLIFLIVLRICENIKKKFKYSSFCLSERDLSSKRRNIHTAI